MAEKKIDYLDDESGPPGMPYPPIVKLRAALAEAENLPGDIKRTIEAALWQYERWVGEESLQEYNPHHDPKNGRFTSKAKSGAASLGDFKRRGVSIEKTLAQEGFSLRGGRVPKTGFMVSLPGHGRVIDLSKSSPEAVQRAVRDWVRRESAFVTSTPDTYFGGWKEGGRLHLDISANVQDRAAAIRLGAKNNQIAIYDLSADDEIPTGGTGDAVEVAESAGAGRQRILLGSELTDDEAIEAMVAWALGEDLQEYNMWHDRRGRFTTKAGNVSGGAYFGHPLETFGDMSMLSAEQSALLDENNRKEFGLGSGEMIRHGVSNALELAESAWANPKQAHRDAKWYARVQNFCRTMSQKTGAAPWQIAAITAVTSANRAWDKNANDVMKIMKAASYKGKVGMSREQAEYAAKNIHQSQYNKMLKAEKSSMAERLGISTKDLSKEQKDEAVAAVFSSEKWRTLTKSTVEDAMVPRTLEELYDHPSGPELFVAGRSERNKLLPPDATPLPILRSNTPTEKTLRILRGDDPNDIITAYSVGPDAGLMLSSLKTRNFYNNIISGGSDRSSTTDLHMAEAYTAGLRWQAGSKRGQMVDSTTATRIYNGTRGAMMGSINRNAARAFNKKHGTNYTPPEFQAMVWGEIRRRKGPDSSKPLQSWYDWKDTREPKP